MRVLFLSADLGIPVLGGKGAAVHVRAMVDAFVADGHRVSLVAPQLVRSPWAVPAPVDAPVIVVPPGAETVATTSALRAFAAAVGASATGAGEVRRVLYNQELLVALRRRFEHDPPDFIYERASLFGTAGATFASEMGLPHLLELNAPLVDEQQRYRGGGALGDLADASEQWLLDHVSAVLPVSTALAAHVVDRGVAAERVHVVPNGIDPARFHPGPRDPSVRRRLGIGDGPVIGFVGGLRPWHGVEGLPRLAAILRRIHPELEVLVVGDGPLRLELERAAAAAGLSSCLRLVGAIPHEEVPAAIREMDVALAPYGETTHLFYFSPLKIFEYMACGVPVVAARLGQIAEVIDDWRTGVLHAPGDVDELAVCCLELLASAERRFDIGGRAADLVRERYTWAANARRVAALAQATRETTEIRQ